MDDLISVTELSCTEELVVSESRNVVSNLALLIDISNEDLVYSIFDKKGAFDFRIVNLPDLSGNIPTAPAYGTYISQPMRYNGVAIIMTGFLLNIPCLQLNFSTIVSL